MKSTSLKEPLVLSIIFNTRGFGYALFEGVVAPVDWGIKTVKDKNDYFEHVRVLLHLFEAIGDCCARLCGKNGAMYRHHPRSDQSHRETGKKEKHPGSTLFTH